MKVFQDGFRHSAWANEALLAMCVEAGPERIAAASEGMYQPLDAILRHVLQVEHGYLRLVGAPRPDGDTATMGLDALRALTAEVRDAYVAFVGALDAQALERPIFIPWFDASVSTGDALLQVLTHSAEHRADVVFALSRAGFETPPMDYVMWAVGVRDSAS